MPLVSTLPVMHDKLQMMTCLLPLEASLLPALALTGLCCLHTEPAAPTPTAQAPTPVVTSAGQLPTTKAQPPAAKTPSAETASVPSVAASPAASPVATGPSADAPAALTQTPAASPDAGAAPMLIFISCADHINLSACMLGCHIRTTPTE